MGGVYVAPWEFRYTGPASELDPSLILLSERRVMNSKLNLPVGVAVFAALVVGLMFLLPGGLLQAQDNGP